MVSVWPVMGRASVPTIKLASRLKPQCCMMHASLKSGHSNGHTWIKLTGVTTFRPLTLHHKRVQSVLLTSRITLKKAFFCIHLKSKEIFPAVSVKQNKCIREGRNSNSTVTSVWSSDTARLSTDVRGKEILKVTRFKFASILFNFTSNYHFCWYRGSCQARLFVSPSNHFQ